MNRITRLRVPSACLAALLALAACAGPGGGPAPGPDGWIALFDGKSLGRWARAAYDGENPVSVKDGMLLLDPGQPMTGIVWTGEPPARMGYEITLDAMRTQGGDIFCGLTFPVGKDPCALIIGGWGGTVVGLSCIDGFDSSGNSTTRTLAFESERWYRIRLKVTPATIEAWIDDEQVVNLATRGRTISIRIESEPCVPLGIGTWMTGAAIRSIRIRKID